MKKWQMLLGLLLSGALAFSGCGGGGGGGGGGGTTEVPVASVEGTWFFTVDNQPAGLQVITQNGVNFTLGGACENGSGGRPMTIDEVGAVQCSWTYPTGTATMSGTLSDDKQTITGTWVNSELGSGDWVLEKVSNSTASPSSGTLTINGSFDGVVDAVKVNALPACAEKDYRAESGPMLDDIEINTQNANGWWGLEFETPEMLAVGTYDIATSGFIIEFQSSIILAKFGILDELAATGGTVTITTYDGNVLKGTFNIQSDYYDLTGSFDVNLGGNN